MVPAPIVSATEPLSSTLPADGRNRPLHSAGPGSLDAFTRLIALSLSARHALIWIEEHGNTAVKSTSGLDIAAAQRVLAALRPILDRLATSSAPLLVNDVRNHSILSSDTVLRDLDIGGLAVVRLLSPLGIPIGGCCVLDGDAREWSSRDRAVIDTVVAGLYSQVGPSLLATSAQQPGQQSDLLPSELRYRHLVEQARDMIYQADVNGRFIYVNPVASHIMGYDTADLLRMNFVDLIQPEYREEVRAFYAEQVRSGTPNTYYEFPAVAADGRVIWVGQNVQLLVHDSEVIGAQAVARDITERRSWEAAVRQSEARKRAIGKASLDCIITIDEDGRVMEFNPAAEATFGYQEADVLGRSVEELIIPRRYRDMHNRGRQQFCAEGRGSIVGNRVELTGMRSDGSEFPVEIAIASVVQEDGSRIFTGILRDITQRKQAEAELVDAMKIAERAVQAKSSLLAAMSHEIRTPMHAILGAAELLLDSSLRPDESELARMVQSNANALLVLLNAFLDSAKIDAGQLDIEEKVFDARAIVDDVAATLYTAVCAKQLELLATVDPDLPPRLLGDPARIRQILLNIADNAVKYTPQGEIAIYADARPSSSNPGVRDLHFSVSDTGIGIAPTDQERIFDPFTQVSEPAQRAGGTGLGLNICRKLAALMGGHIEVESEPGRGSTFHLVLPLRVAVEAEPVQPARRWLDGVHGLLILPPGSTRTMIAAAARQEGCAVSECGTVTEGFAVLHDEDLVDPLIVVDDRVPDYPGAARFARAIEERFNVPVPVVVICARDASDCDAMPSEESCVCVRRPLRSRALMDAIRRVREVQRPGPRVPEARLPRIPIAPRVGARILVAEDSHDDRAITERILQAARFAVDVCGSGEEAVVMARTNRYDAIVLDINLPGINGFLTARTIRAQEHEDMRDRAPILALTALTGESVRERAIESGMDGYMAKPASAHHLVETIARSLDPRPAILIADDSPDERTLLERVLQQAPYRVVIVEDGRAAIDAFTHQGFSLVLLDVEMPGVTGYDVARAIRLNKHGALVPIIALTGHTGVAAGIQALRAGFTGHITKPVRRDDLLALIAHAVAPLGTREAARDASLSLIKPAVPPRWRRPSHAEARKELSAEIVVEPHLADLVPGFLDNRRADSRKVIELLDTEQFDQIETLGHNIKGTSAGYGFNELSMIGAELESAAAAADRAHIREVANHLQQHLSQLTWTARSGM